jgi:hypothetical protein
LNRWVFKALVPAFVACALWAGCSNRGDEGDIRALIADGAALAEAHDIAGNAGAGIRRCAGHAHGSGP